MNLALAGIEIVLVALIALVARFIGRHASQGPRATVLAFVFGVGAAVASGAFMIASVNYRWPLAWIVGVAAAAALEVALFALLGREVGWKPLPALSLVGLFALGALLFGTPLTMGVGTDAIRPMYTARTAQIARAQGFTTYMPSTEKLPTDMLPVEALPAPDKGLVLSYRDFTLRERPTDAGPSFESLHELVKPGTLVAQDVRIPESAEVTTLSVRGVPAVGVSFDSPHQKGPVAEKTTLLVLIVDGTELRFWALGSEEFVDGKWQPQPALSPAKLATIAESLEAVK